MSTDRRAAFAAAMATAEPRQEKAAAVVASSRALIEHAAQGRLTPEAAGVYLTSLVGMVRTLEMSINSLAAQRTALVAVAAGIVDAMPAVMVPVSADGPPTGEDRDHARRALVAELATGTGASQTATATLMTTATELVHRLPAVLAVMGTGVLGDRHVRQVVRHGEGIPAEATEAYQADVLAKVPTHRTPAGIARAARLARERVHPQSLTQRHERAFQDRAVHLDPAADGMACLSAFLPAVQAGAIFDKLTGIARALVDDDTEAGPEQRTLAQRRADALTSLTLDAPGWDLPTVRDQVPRGAPGPGAGGDGSARYGRDRLSSAQTAHSGTELVATSSADVETAATAETTADDLEHAFGTTPPPWALDPALRALRPTVAVTVPAMTLLGRSEEPGHLDGYGPIDPDTARVLAAHAPSFIRLLTHPETGTVLSVGRDRYTVPADLRTWLRLRDQTCRFPGCQHPATGADIDHGIPFRQDGARGQTAASNLAHLCRRHHRLKHTSHWHVQHEPDGCLTWTSPTGQTHTTEPALHLPTNGTGEPPPDDGTAPPPDDPGPPPGDDPGPPLDDDPGPPLDDDLGPPPDDGTVTLLPAHGTITQPPDSDSGSSDDDAYPGDAADRADGGAR